MHVYYCPVDYFTGVLIRYNRNNIMAIKYNVYLIYIYVSVYVYSVYSVYLYLLSLCMYCTYSHLYIYTSRRSPYNIYIYISLCLNLYISLYLSIYITTHLSMYIYLYII